MALTAKDGFKYILVFTDDHTGAIFTYFLKAKSDTVKGTEKFVSDVVLYGKIICIRGQIQWISVTT